MLLTASPAGLDPSLRSMLVRIFDLRSRTARHVMSLRSDAATLRGSMTIEEAVRRPWPTRATRATRCSTPRANGVLGYIHLRDLFDVLVGTPQGEAPRRAAA
jgi:CBS domain containing-hemolysin-like protein